eukprot:352473-Chlamydomonas_euryale.AAC.2
MTAESESELQGRKQDANMTADSRTTAAARGGLPYCTQLTNTGAGSHVRTHMRTEPVVQGNGGAVHMCKRCPAFTMHGVGLKIHPWRESAVHAHKPVSRQPSGQSLRSWGTHAHVDMNL